MVHRTAHKVTNGRAILDRKIEEVASKAWCGKISRIRRQIIGIKFLFDVIVNMARGNIDSSPDEFDYMIDELMKVKDGSYNADAS